MGFFERVGRAMHPKIEIGTWVPHIYDYTTKVTELTASDRCIAKYVKFNDDLCLFGFICSLSRTFNINTMLQIRNKPCNLVFGGGAYINGNSPAIQGSSVGIYFRPNITGIIGSTSAYYIMSGIFLGSKDIF